MTLLMGLVIVLALSGCGTDRGENTRAAAPPESYPDLSPDSASVDCDDPGLTMAEYTEKCVGEQPPDGESSEERLPTEMQPFDGGSHTWQVTGITMRLSIEKVEPWGGEGNDFCGDGSCGVADPDDVRMVLKYEVTVPESYDEPFDPVACPGDLHVTSGNDDEAFSTVAGDEYKSLDGPMLPGTTKFGIQEIYIEKAYAAEEFFMDSTCGEDYERYSGETAYFSGKIEDVKK
ncbi:MAG: hypothetical protein H7Y15_07730 [Pseudonocardia sp.]|nr:hypothetical protein [Pseudonocardia sp.]